MGEDAPAARLLSALVMRPALSGLGDGLATAAGHAVSIVHDSAGAVGGRIRGGEACDVAIVQKPLIDALAREGKVVPDSIAVLARSGLAMAVRDGIAKPGIETAGALRHALLNAGSIACPDPAKGHLSGIHFRSVIERLGLAAALAPKIRLMDGVLADFASTDVDEVAITQPMEILAAPGYAMAGWLPAELQDAEKFTWAAGIGANAAMPGAAEAMIRFLSSPAAATVIKAKGMIPEANTGT